MSDKSSEKGSEANSVPKNMIIALRDFQLLLKRENILINFQQHEIDQITDGIQSEYEFILHVNKILLAYHEYSLENSGLKLPQQIFDSLCTPIDLTTRPALLREKPEVTEYYSKIINHFNVNNNDFATVCVEYAQPLLELGSMEQIDRLTFSIIPSFFGFLSYQEFANKYVDFMKIVLERNPEVGAKFGRLLFVIPEFRLFLSRIIAKFQKPVQNMIPNDMERFKKDFCALWLKYIEYCPFIIKQVIKHCTNKEEFLVKAFISPAFHAMKSYGIIPYNASLSKEIIEKMIETIGGVARTLVKNIEESKQPSSLCFVRDIYEIAPDLSKTFLLTFQDLQIVSELAAAADRILNKFPVKQIPYKDSFTTRDFTVYVIKTVSKKFEAKGKDKEGANRLLSSKDKMEEDLRSLLSEVNTIPLGAQAMNADFEELLSHQILLSSEDEKLHLKMKLQDFKKSLQRISDEGQVITFEETLQLLQEKFDGRTKSRQNLVQRVSTFNAGIAQLKGLKKNLLIDLPDRLLMFQYQLVEKWSSEVNPMKNLPSDVCDSVDKFIQFFRNVVDSFNNWLGNKGYSAVNDYAIVHDFIMLGIPLSTFVRKYPAYSRQDIECSNSLRENKESFIRSTSESFMVELLKNPKLTEPALIPLRASYVAPTPIAKVIYLNRFREKVDQILKCEGIKEVGADQATPMTLALICLSEPDKFPSNLEYINFFFGSVAERISDIPILKHQNQSSYTVVMMNASLLHIKNEFPKIDPTFNPQQNGM